MRPEHPVTFWLALVIPIWIVSFGSAIGIAWRVHAQEEGGYSVPSPESTATTPDTSGANGAPTPEVNSGSEEGSQIGSVPNATTGNGGAVDASTPISTETVAAYIVAGTNLEAIVNDLVQAPLLIPAAAPLPEEISERTVANGDGGETGENQAQVPAESTGITIPTESGSTTNGLLIIPTPLQGEERVMQQLRALVEVAKNEALVHKGVGMVSDSLRNVLVPEIILPPRSTYADIAQMLAKLQLSLAKVEVAAAIKPRLDRVFHNETKTLLNQMTAKYKTDLDNTNDRADELNRQMQEFIDLLKPMADQTPGEGIKTTLLKQVKSYREGVNNLRSLEGLSVEAVASETQ